MTLKEWIIASRPKTLSASWIPVLVGSAAAYKLENKFSFILFACTFIASLLIQVATNFINDAIDFKKGADTKERIGPQRMVLEGKISFKQMLNAGFFCLIVAAFLGAILVWHAGSAIFIIGLLSVFLAYSYTGGPLPLAYLGLGDIFVLLFFGVIAVTGSFYVQVHHWNPIISIAGVQIGLLAVVLLAINNFRDMVSDKKANKKTLAVRFGANFMKTEILVCIFLPYLLLYFWYKQHLLFASLLPLFSFPLAAKLFYQIYKSQPSPVFNKYLAQAGLLHLVFGILLTVGILIS